MLSSSHVAALDAEGQQAVRAEVEAVLERHPETRGQERIEIPYNTEVYWTHRL
jgi:hypothetical protein